MAVDRSHLGRRYTCFSCGCKFYDLNRPEPLCPKCEANQLDDPSPDPRVAAMAASRKARKAAAAASAAADAKVKLQFSSQEDEPELGEDNLDEDGVLSLDDDDDDLGPVDEDSPDEA